MSGQEDPGKLPSTLNQSEWFRNLPAITSPTLTVAPAEQVNITRFLEPLENNAAEQLPRIRLGEAGEEPLDSPPDLIAGEIIGTGGMGMVMAADQESLHRIVAVKTLHGHRIGPSNITGMIQEARLLARLAHPGIPPVHALGKSEKGHPLLVMQRIEGRPWDELLASRPDPDDPTVAEPWLLEQLSFLVRVSEAVAYAHQQQVLHRDIKPANVIIGDFGRVYTIDWGIAVELGDSLEYEARHFAGTPAYSAPEMLTADCPLSPATDVYLLGATLHEILTGVAVHDQGSLPEIIKHVTESDPPVYDEKIPTALGDIVLKATAKSPGDRHRSAKLFAQEITDFIRNHSTLEERDEVIKTLQDLREMNQSSRSSPHYFSDLASQCLGSLDRLQLILPGDEEIESMLLEVLTMHAHHALKHQNASMARAHVNRLKDMTGMDQDDLERMQLELHALSQQYASTQDELATRIQYTLMEKIATLTKERDELRQALQDATDEHP